MSEAGIPPVPRVPLDDAWHSEIARRVSRRRFDGRPLPSEAFSSLTRTAEMLSADGVRVVVRAGGGEGVYRGIVASYGKVAGAPSFAAFAGPDDAGLAIGYTGEALVLEASRLGIGSCWVAWYFDREAAARVAGIAEGERVHAVTPLGFALAAKHPVEHLMSASVRSRSRSPHSRIAPGSEGWPAWARAAAEAVRLAPSGGNGQPWRLWFEGGTLVLGEKSGRVHRTHLMDCGIAMLHAELGARSEGVRGAWEALPAPDIARLVV